MFFDRYVVIKDCDGCRYMDESLVERLNEMLNTYGVYHAFSLPREDSIEDFPEAVVVCFTHNMVIVNKEM